MMDFVAFGLYLPFVCIVLSVPFRGNTCTYEFNVETKVFNIACDKNTTLTVNGNGKTMFISQTHHKLLWFEKLFGSNIMTSKHSKSVREILGPNTKIVRKLREATKLLRRAKKRLVYRIEQIENITDTLIKGDKNLPDDLNILNKKDSNLGYSWVHRAHRSMVAALQNQFHYLKRAMVTQNRQMKGMIAAIMSLVSATQKTVRSTLAMNRDFQKEMIMLNKALLRSNISESKTRKGFCPRRLVRIGNGDRVYKAGIKAGTMMKDPTPTGQIWVTYGFSDINVVMTFKNFEDFGSNTASAQHVSLPFYCEGTGSVVYENTLYCHKMMTNKIVQYNLVTNRWLGELELRGMGARNTFPEESGLFSDVDFAIDEYGVWVVYPSDLPKGNIIISKLSERDLNITNTWTTNIPKQEVANLFIICGVLYGVESFDEAPTFIKYMYDTNTGGSKTLSPTDIPFQNAIGSTYAHAYMLDYNPMDRTLIAWNHGRVEIYSIDTIIQ